MDNTARIIAPPYHVQSTAANVRNGFPCFAHHESVSQLWSEKWRRPCAAGLYAFFDAKLEDFEPIFAELAKISNDDPSILYRPDDYAKPFFPAAQGLIAQAEEAMSEGSIGKARDLFLRAAAVYRIARFPINRIARSSLECIWISSEEAYRPMHRSSNSRATMMQNAGRQPNQSVV